HGGMVQGIVPNKEFIFFSITYTYIKTINIIFYITKDVRKQRLKFLIFQFSPPLSTKRSPAYPLGVCWAGKNRVQRW
ncbi:MAG: hypothetical protein J5947_06965, partial [Clostridium sp.]|nr:hypothetical protein [Clostridium sp.]